MRRHALRNWRTDLAGPRDEPSRLYGAYELLPLFISDSGRRKVTSPCSASRLVEARRGSHRRGPAPGRAELRPGVLGGHRQHRRGVLGTRVGQAERQPVEGRVARVPRDEVVENRGMLPGLPLEVHDVAPGCSRPGRPSTPSPWAGGTRPRQQRPGRRRGAARRLRGPEASASSGERSARSGERREPFSLLRESKGVTLGLLRAEQPELSDATAIAASLEAPAAFAVSSSAITPPCTAIWRAGWAPISPTSWPPRPSRWPSRSAAATTAATPMPARGCSASPRASPSGTGAARSASCGRTRARESIRRAPAHDDHVAAQADSAAAAPVLAAALAQLSRDERDVLLLYAWAELAIPGDRGGAVDLSRHRQVTTSSRTRTRAPTPGAKADG